MKQTPGIYGHTHIIVIGSSPNEDDLASSGSGEISLEFSGDSSGSGASGDYSGSGEYSGDFGESVTAKSVFSPKFFLDRLYGGVSQMSDFIFLV